MQHGWQSMKSVIDYRYVDPLQKLKDA